MDVVVTGGSGFIGTHLVEQLVACGDEVTVLDLTEPASPAAHFTEASVLDPGAVTRCIAGADAVIHLAGHVRGGVRKDPYGGASLQVQGTLNVIEACRAAQVPHLSYASSFYVYDGVSSDRTVDESTVLDPTGMELFGSAKYVGEVLCRDWESRGGSPCTVFRIGAAYGPGGSSAVGDFVDTGLRGETIEVWGRGERRNQYTYVGDIADGIVAGMQVGGSTFNLATTEAISTAGLAAILDEDYGFVTNFDHDRAEGPSMPYISSELAVERLGWRPRSLRDGIACTVQASSEALGAGPQR